MPPLWSFTLALSLLAIDEQPPPALEVVALHPDRQLSTLLSFFEGTSAANPADLLASYRRATGKSDILGKAPQALIAALNPSMINELARLHQATFRLAIRPPAGESDWSLRVNNDDGTFADLAIALALTDGHPEAPVGDESTPIDRLDENSPVLAATRDGTLVFANHRDTLERILLASSANPGPVPGLSDPAAGIRISVNPPALKDSDNPVVRRLSQSLSAASVNRLDAISTLDDDSLKFHAVAQLPHARITRGIDPDWLTALPADFDAAFSVTLTPGDGNLELFSGLLDGLFPKSENAATAAVSSSSRTRLNTLALLAGVSTELELWPRLLGLSGAFDLDKEKTRPNSAILILHARDPNAADRLANRVLPRLMLSLRLLSDKEAPDIDLAFARTHAISLGDFHGQPISLALRENDVLLAWGQTALDNALAIRANPDRSLGRTSWLQTVELDQTNHLLLVHPQSFLKSQLDPQSPMALAVQLAPPLLVLGRRSGEELDIEATWSGLRQTVRRLVDATPQAPAPEPLP